MLALYGPDGEVAAVPLLPKRALTLSRVAHQRRRGDKGGVVGCGAAGPAVLSLVCPRPHKGRTGAISAPDGPEDQRQGKGAMKRTQNGQIFGVSSMLTGPNYRPNEKRSRSRDVDFAGKLAPCPYFSVRRWLTGY